ncbi:MAG: cupin domain-containing protein [Candidatus Hermodarchaeota archaeon]
MNKNQNMIAKKNSIKPIDFSGLEIYDYTAGLELQSSFALIQVLPNACHAESWSTRSDKYYYILRGEIQFTLEGEEFKLSEGDFCVVLKGKKFSYKNIQKNLAQLILVHTPSFDLKFENFKTSSKKEHS